jgi:hypothetical protein
MPDLSYPLPGALASFTVTPFVVDQISAERQEGACGTEQRTEQIAAQNWQGIMSAACASPKQECRKE